LMSTGCKSSHSGFLDVSRSNGGLRISGWIGQLSCLTTFPTSLSVAAFFRRAGGSILEDSTGSHGRGVERRVPEMRRMVEFNCTLTATDRQRLEAVVWWGIRSGLSSSNQLSLAELVEDADVDLFSQVLYNNSHVLNSFFYLLQIQEHII